MKKKKNPVFNQPVEVPWDLLAAQNVILVRWTEDTAGTTPGQPVPAADEPPKVNLKQITLLASVCSYDELVFKLTFPA